MPSVAIQPGTSVAGWLASAQEQNAAGLIGFKFEGRSDLNGIWNTAFNTILDTVWIEFKIFWGSQAVDLFSFQELYSCDAVKPAQSRVE